MISSPGKKSHHSRVKRRDESIKGTQPQTKPADSRSGGCVTERYDKTKEMTVCYRTSGDVQSGNDPRSYKAKRVQKVAEEQVKKSKR